MKKLSLISIALAPFISFSTATAEECLKVASPPTTIGIISKIVPGVKKTFDMAGLCVNYIQMPAKRIQKQMTEGALDAEFMRVMPYILAMKDHVIHIPTPLAEAKGLLVTLKSSGFTPETLGDIGGKKIGLVHGIKWHEIMATKLKSTSKSKKFQNTAKQLKAGRVDGMLIDQVTLAKIFSEGILDKSDVHSSQVADLSAYLVIHKRNSNMISKIDEAVKKVKSSGGFSLN